MTPDPRDPRILEITNDFRQDLDRFLGRWLDNLNLLEVPYAGSVIIGIPLAEALAAVSAAYEIKGRMPKGTVARQIANFLLAQCERAYREITEMEGVKSPGS